MAMINEWLQQPDHLIEAERNGVVMFWFCSLLPVMNDPIEHATGLEKRELLARQAGDNDPFDMRVFKRGPGTKESPNMIPSAFESRLVGCVCE